MNIFFKISIVFLCCFLPLFALAQETPSADLQVVAFSNPLLQYPENGEHKGPTNEILKGLLKTTQLSANISYMPWARAFSKAINTPNTLILSILRTPERENSFQWIIKVSQAARVFISLQSKPEKYVETMEQAKQKLIAVILDSAAHKELSANGFSEQENLYIVSNEENMINLLLNQRVDLIYSDPNNIERGLLAMGKAEVKIRFKQITPENQRMSYIALNKKSNKSIVKLLQKAADQYSKTPEYEYFLNN